MKPTRSSLASWKNHLSINAADQTAGLLLIFRRNRAYSSTNQEPARGCEKPTS
jgi:hypothetical protein